MLNNLKHSLFRKIFDSSFLVLFTLPTFIAIFIGCLPVLMVWLDNLFQNAIQLHWDGGFTSDKAQTILSVIAGGAITALSLTYSLTLVVFTLAAGNIGPRLLKRFTSDKITQITAGVFGGTFLYALLTLIFTEPDYVPTLTVVGGCLLAIISVVLLIYFVRHVSKSITIDDEIADIAKRLRLVFQQRYIEKNDAYNFTSAEFPYQIASDTAGYLNDLKINHLVELGKRKDVVMRFFVPPGSYLIEGQNLIQTSKELKESDARELLDCIVIAPARTQDNTIEFSINLLLEIALRALSPGINDTFTAIAVVDSITETLSLVANVSDFNSCHLDDDGRARLVVPETSTCNLVRQAFHPIRRASAGNLIMVQALARAYSRLHHNGNREVRDEILTQIKMMMDDVERTTHHQEDTDSVVASFSETIQKQIS